MAEFRASTGAIWRDMLLAEATVFYLFNLNFANGFLFIHFYISFLFVILFILMYVLQFCIYNILKIGEQ